MKAGSRFAVEWIGSKLEFGNVGSLRSEFLIIQGQEGRFKMVKMTK